MYPSLRRLRGSVSTWSATTFEGVTAEDVKVAYVVLLGPAAGRRLGEDRRLNGWCDRFGLVRKMLCRDVCLLETGVTEGG